MTVQEYGDYIEARNPVVAGSEAHLFMHQIPKSHPTFNRDKE